MDVFRVEPGTEEENVEKFISGELKEVESATGPAGMGMGGSREGQKWRGRMRR